MVKLIKTVGLYIVQVRVLVDVGYGSVDNILFLIFNDIQNWCKLNTNIPVMRVESTSGNRKINYLQALSWWETTLMLRRKDVALNNFNGYILYGEIKGSRIG